MTGLNFWRGRWPLCVVGLISAFFSFFRLKQIPPGLWFDEAFDGLTALRVSRSNLFMPFYPDNFGREGLLINVQALVLKLVDPSAFAIRAPTALFGVLTVLGFYLLVLELSHTFLQAPSGEHPGGAVQVAAVSSFLYATSFWHVVLSRTAVRSVLAPCFLLWTLTLYLRAQRLETRGAVQLAGVAGAVYGLGFYTYLNYRLTPLLLLVVFLLTRSKPGALRRQVTFSLATLLVLLPLLVYAYAHPRQVFSRALKESVLQTSPLDGLLANLKETSRFFLIEGSEISRHGLQREPLLWPPVAFLMLVGLIVLAVRGRGVLSSERVPGSVKEPCTKLLLLLATWFLVGALPGILARPGTNRLNLLTAPLYFLAGVGVVGIWVLARQKLRTRGALLVPVGLALLVSLIAAREYDLYFQRWGSHPATRAGFLSHVDSLVKRIERAKGQKDTYLVKGKGFYQARTVLEYRLALVDRQATQARRIFFVASDEPIPDERSALVLDVDWGKWSERKP